MFYPSFLDRMISSFRESFNRSDFRIGNSRNRQLAGSHGVAVQVNGAGSTLSDSASEFCPHQIQLIPQHPKHGRIWIDVYLLGFTVDVEIENGHSL
jgi:hypothetical protein